MKALLRTARRRSGDEKGGVRKAAVALVDALVRLRAAPAGPLVPPPAVRLPSESDLEPLQAAASDPLVGPHPPPLAGATPFLETPNGPPA